MHECECDCAFVFSLVLLVKKVAYTTTHHQSFFIHLFLLFLLLCKCVCDWGIKNRILKEKNKERHNSLTRLLSVGMLSIEIKIGCVLVLFCKILNAIVNGSLFVLLL